MTNRGSTRVPDAPPRRSCDRDSPPGCWVPWPALAGACGTGGLRPLPKIGRRECGGAAVVGGEGQAIKAVVQHTYGPADVLHVEDVETPAIRDDEVLVRVVAALSIAMALVSDPQVLFLDEPTLGLDPQARRGMWEHITSLKGEVTIVLTTHHLEEADVLADRVGIIDRGRVVAQGTHAELKSGVSAGPVTTVTATGVTPGALADLRATYPQAVAVDGGVEIPGGDVDLLLAQQLLRSHGVVIDAIGRQQTSLDDVFLTLTGRQWRE